MSGCSDCTPGTVFVSASQACSPGQRGTRRSGQMCENCPAGFLSPGEVDSEFAQDARHRPVTNVQAECYLVPFLPDCSRCHAGSYSGEGQETCSKCPPGTSSTREGATSSDACQDCEAGTAQPDSGAVACNNCADNTVAPDPGSISAAASSRLASLIPLIRILGFTSLQAVSGWNDLCNEISGLHSVRRGHTGHRQLLRALSGWFRVSWHDRLFGPVLKFKRETLWLTFPPFFIKACTACTAPQVPNNAKSACVTR